MAATATGMSVMLSILAQGCEYVDAGSVALNEAPPFACQNQKKKPANADWRVLSHTQRPHQQ
jgi:hypothetical protein